MMRIFWVKTSCSLWDCYHHFREIHSLHPPSRKWTQQFPLKCW